MLNLLESRDQIELAVKAIEIDVGVDITIEVQEKINL